MNVKINFYCYIHHSKLMQLLYKQKYTKKNQSTISLSRNAGLCVYDYVRFRS